MKWKYFLFFACLIANFCTAQQNGVTEIDKAINDGNLVQAQALLTQHTNTCIASGQYDSLVNYIFYIGKLEKKKTDADGAIRKVKQAVEKIKALTTKPATLRQAYIEAGEYYGSIGKNTIGYEANKEAYKYNNLMPDRKPSDAAQIESNLGVFAQRMGDIDLSKQHHRKALQLYGSEADPDNEKLYITYNAMGGIMWYASKLDSASYFYKKALEVLNKTDRTPINQFYRPAILNNNLAGIYGMNGKTTEAINAMKATLSDLKKFIATKGPNPKKASAVTFQFEATDNLASIYKELGDMKQARELLEYSYRQKLANLGPGEPGIFISQILLGQIYFAINEFDKAETFLTDGLNKIEQADDDYLFWQADACNTLALLYDKKKEVAKAKSFYQKADNYYEQSLKGDYDNIYLDFLRNAALFYAENNEPAVAIAKANKAYNYILKTQGAETLEAFYQLLNLSKVYFELNRYAESLTYSNKALAAVNKIIAGSDNSLDSIKIELRKPKVILYRAKAGYELMKDKSVSNLTLLLQDLNEALDVLERRKSIISDPQNINLLMADHNDLIEFVKKINIDLYKSTKQQAYIDRIMSLQESSTYNRIRARLDKNDSIRFVSVPATIQENEKKLKDNITASLQGNASHNEKMRQYFAAVDEWNRFLAKLKTDYPGYYKMRYASIFKPVQDLEKSIPKDATLIRYFFVQKDLYAFLADGKQQKIYPLQTISLEDDIATLGRFGMDAGKTGEILYKLYLQLWAPLAKEVVNKRVIIIPDGILYSLNFDLLTPEKISSFNQLASKSLLAKYAFSYNYSLFLLNPANKEKFSESLVTFAPGFSDNIKKKYRTGTNDPLERDNAYLSLLPQPFTLQLAEKIQGLLGGKAYLNDQSTERSFKANAGKHKIIHIGTHAESNNNYPEFSKLIFAKGNSINEDNELFVHEIYNCDLQSQLTVLTACETGKPGYEDGEGMISLAHAFNYAGSESILTGLWKIDDQASAMLMEDFYKNLVAGMPKDVALQQAKLSYLQKNEGRMLAPQYWAGLIIMGDTTPISLKKNHTYLPWIIAAILLLIGVTALVFLRRRKLRRG